MAPLCEIKFENENKCDSVFWGGQRLRCNIMLNLTKPRIMKGVYVTISGWANCIWTERNTYGNISVTTSYIGQDGYIDSVTYLVGSETSEVSELPAGIHTYSFVYDIPPNLPSSIEGEKGHIRYGVRVTINRPFPLLDDNYKQDFILIKPFDLNKDIETFGVSSEGRVSHSFCCFACRSAPFSAVARIPQTGYVPGQDIKVNIEAKNRSYVKINSIKTTLCQFIEYFSVTPPDGRSIDLKKITVSRVEGVERSEKKCYDVTLRIPPIPPTDEESSKTIHVTYCIKVKFNTNWLHTSPSLYVPITIGTVPLGNSNINIFEQCHRSPNTLASAPVEESIYDMPSRIRKHESDELCDKVEDTFV